MLEIEQTPISYDCSQHFENATSYSLLDAPSWLSIDNNGLMSGLADDFGTDSVTVVGTNVDGDTQSNVFLMRALFGYSSEVISDGAVGFWPLDEESGTDIFAVVGDDGSIVGTGYERTDNLSIGEYAKALQTTSTATYGVVPNPLTATDGFTVEFWIKDCAYDSATALLCAYDGSYSWIIVYGYNNGARLYYASGLYLTLPTATYLDNGEHHIVVVFNSEDPTASVRMYVDGEEFSNHNPALTKPAQRSQLRIGSYLPGNGNPGQYSCVAVYDSVLTPGQIAKHYAVRMDALVYFSADIPDQVALLDFDFVLDVSAFLLTGGEVSGYSLNGAPPWMSIDNSGVITGSHDTEQTYNGITVTATNKFGAKESNDFSLEVMESPVAPHKYYRVWVVAFNGRIYWGGLREVEMMAAPGGADQCVGGTPTHSSLRSAGEGSDKAFDDLLTTQWRTQDNTYPTNQWVRYEFPNPVAVNQFTLRAESITDAMAKDFRLECSDNGTDWTVLTEYTGETGWGNNEMRTFDVVVA